jgi:hypothetical protein
MSRRCELSLAWMVSCWCCWAARVAARGGELPSGVALARKRGPQLLLVGVVLLDHGLDLIVHTVDGVLHLGRLGPQAGDLLGGRLSPRRVRAGAGQHKAGHQQQADGGSSAGKPSAVGGPSSSVQLRPPFRAGGLNRGGTRTC